MEKQEKIKLMEEVMDLEEGTLSESDTLSSYEEWDSLSVLAFMSVLTSKFQKNVLPKDIKNLVTVSDALNLME
ncbi:MAG: hypothetical protein IKN43_06460 [Selenomonadaceae bacterium]|nr:hypothetical protein [Selenomonadaceae bacterium]